VAKWKLFRRSKLKKETEPEREEIAPLESEDIAHQGLAVTVETEQESEEPAIPEHHEALYPIGHTPKKNTMATAPYEEPWKREGWENAATIEKNVDNLDTKAMEARLETQAKPLDVSDIDKKVDKLLVKMRKYS